MVGIVIASHGGFATGILQSSQMIFGEQPDVAAVTLQPEQGPDDIRRQMEDAIAGFESQEEVLFLADLWGGTPFNQANNLVSTHEKWAIVAGMNLPMLLQAFDARTTEETAHEVARQIIEEAKEGVRIYPESLEPKKEVPIQKKNQALPEGTVVGNGKIQYVLARVDSRLLHGQVATSWTKKTNPNRILVVSDSVAHDELRKKLITEAAPPGVKANVIPISKMIEVSKDPRFGNTKALLLFETPQDVLKAVEGGVEIKELNVGSMAHSVGKVVVNKAIAMNMDDVKTFEALKQKGIKFDVRKVPADAKENLDDMLKKAKAELKNVKA